VYISKSSEKLNILIVDNFIILIFVAISIISLDKYQYGVNDHSITIPFLKAFVNNSLYPNDYLLPERFYFYTFLWNFLGLIVKFCNVNLHILFFVVHLVSTYLTFFAVYLLAIALFKKREIAFLALFFLIFNYSTLGSGVTLETYLTTKGVAMPLLLFSMLFFFQKKYLLSYFLQGVGFLIHPLSAAYMFAILFVSLVLSLKNIGLKKFLHCILIFIITISPILIWKIICSPPSLGLIHVDNSWLELQRLRSSHHIFPFTWGKNIFLQAGLFTFVFLLSWKYKPKEVYHHHVVLWSMNTIFTLCFLGTVFTEFIPISIVIQFQLFRSFVLLRYFAIIYFANFYFNEIKTQKKFLEKLYMVFISIGILYQANLWKYAFIAFLAHSLFTISYGYLYQRELQVKYFVSTLLIPLFAIGFIHRDVFSINNTQEKNWVDVQMWAKQNTNINDFFIVPPNQRGFRIDSERTIYCDWKDGTQAFFNPDFGKEWMRRIKSLGYKKGNPDQPDFVDTLKKDYMDLDENDFIKIANEVKNDFRKIFIVMYKERAPLNFPAIYNNQKFTVYEIPDY
jgi:hypothetical protein